MLPRIPGSEAIMLPQKAIIRFEYARASTSHTTVVRDIHRKQEVVPAPPCMQYLEMELSAIPGS